MCNKNTYIWRNPGGWSPLMCMAETVRSQIGSPNHTKFNNMFSTILRCTDLATLVCQTSSFASLLHQLVARKHEDAVWMVCEAIGGAQDGGLLLRDALATANSKALCIKMYGL